MFKRISNKIDNKVRSTIEPYFDEDYYVLTYPDVASAKRNHGLEPIEHFIRFGFQEKRNPNPEFNTKAYYDKFPELVASGINPLYHFIMNSMPKNEKKGGLPEMAAGHNGKDLLAKVKKTFDYEYYAATYPEICNINTNSETLFKHYLEYGWQEGRNPNDYFQTKRYIAEHPYIINERKNPLIHYVQQGMPPLTIAPIRTFYCSKFLFQQNVNRDADLFDELYYFSRYFDCFIGNEHGHYNRNGRNGFNPLFDVEFYLSQIPNRDRSTKALEHYISKGWKEGLSPHPLFNVDYYLKQLGVARLEEPALLHFLTKGWRQNISSHPLFDPQHYKKKSKIDDDTCPVIHYLLAAGDNGEPHYLFSDQYYRMNQHLEFGGRAELVHYLHNPNQKNAGTHHYFDPKFYINRLEKLEVLEGHKSGHYKVEAEKAPLVHYVTKGWKLHISPTRIFDNLYYLDQIDDQILGDPLRHFFTLNGYIKHSGHPAFDIDYYKKKATGFSDGFQPAILHFQQTARDQRASFHPFLDVEYYQKYYQDIAENNLCPLEHFLKFGIYEGRRPNAVFSDPYVLSRSPHASFVGENAVLHYLRHQKERPIRIIFTSHEASRTGAPSIILRLMQDFAKLKHVECISILNEGGDLLDEFKKASFAHVTQMNVKQVGPNHPGTRQEIRQLLDLFSDSLPVVAICNSMGSKNLAEYIHELGIPIIFLIHEVIDYFKGNEILDVADMSEAVVFPSQFIDTRARVNGKYVEDKMSVKGQGLLNDRFGEMDRSQARRKICSELGLPDTAFLVIGCGTVDLRKGIDYFCAAARKALQMRTDNQPMYFIWVGGGDFGWHSDYHVLSEENRRLGYSRYIHFIGERTRVEPYFVAADLFLLTSRTDPFPCVVHEAMAAKLPVILFDEGGGATELVGDFGFSVPIGDTDAMARKIMELKTNESFRRSIGAGARNEIVTNWRSSEYSKYFQELISRITGLSMSEFGLEGEPPSDTIPIYVLASDWDAGEVCTFASILVEEMNKKGRNAKIVFTRGRKSKIRYHNGVPALPEEPTIFLQPAEQAKQCDLQALADWFKNASPCIVIPNDDCATSYLSKIFPPDIGVIGIAHSDDAEHYEPIYRLGHFWQKIVGVNQAVSNKIVHLNPAFKEKSVTIGYGIKVDHDMDIQTKFIKYYKKLEIVNVARFTTNHSQMDRYFELVEQLISRNIPFNMTIFGNGVEYDRLRGALTGYKNWVHFPGVVQHHEMLDKLKTSHLLAVLSDQEALTISLLEAMSVGCVPLLFNGDGGIGDVVKPGVNGLVVNDGNVAKAADIISESALNIQGLLPLAKASRQTVIDMNLTVEGMTDQYLSIIDEVSREIRENRIDRSKFYDGSNRSWRQLSLQAELNINREADLL